MNQLIKFFKRLIIGIPAKGQESSPKGIERTICPESYLQEWKINDINKISNNIIYIK